MSRRSDMSRASVRVTGFDLDVKGMGIELARN
jgi:hypothetical protein